MDGTLAVLFLVAGLADMGINHCGHGQGLGGCLGQTSETARLSFGYGNVIFDEDTIDHEVYLRYELGQSYGPFQPAIAASLTGEGDAWIGAGATWTGHYDQAYLQLSLMPGLHAEGGGPDLGHAIEFRSGIELGYEARNGIRYGLSYDHRSNADLSSVNPGLETLQARISVPLN